MAKIHPTAIVSGDVQVDDSAEIGPWCIVEGAVTLGAGVRLINSVRIQGPVKIGQGTLLYPGAAIGYEPQDYKFTPGSKTAGVEVGEHCLIRENVTVHAATKADVPTRVGSRVFMMANSHVGHDGRVEDGVNMMNGASIAGHSHIGPKAILSGGIMVHQFARIGRLAMMSALSAVSNDVPPFCLVAARNRISGVNVVGMRRAGYASREITEVRRAYREVLRAALMRSEVIEELTKRGVDSPAVAEMAQFVRESKRGVCASSQRRAALGAEMSEAE